MSCSFEIISDLPVVVGSKIEGFIVLKFNKPTKIKEIQVRFYGREKTENDETDFKNINLETFLLSLCPTYRREEFRGNYNIIDVDQKIVAIQVQLHGSEGTQTIGDTKDVNRGRNILVNLEKAVIDEEFVVSSGISKYEFSIDVPDKLPSSFKLYNGEIKYSLKAEVKRTHMLLDMSASLDIEMVAYIDLNTYLPALQIKADFSEDRLVSNCCGFSRGRIMINAVVGKRLFLLGETISLDLNIVNLSGVNVKKVYGRIQKTVTIYFERPYPKEEKYTDYITKSPSYQGVKGYSETTFTLDVDIPRNIFIPNLRYSKLFKITYQLQVIAALSGCHTNMVLQFKIYIGHLPFSAEAIDWRDLDKNTTASTSSLRRSL